MWQEWDMWMERRKLLSTNTRDQYRRRAVACDRWMRDVGRRIDWATTDELRDWLDTLPTTAGSRNQARKALVCLFTWLAEVGRRRDNPAAALEHVPAPRGRPRPCPRPTMLLDLMRNHSDLMHTFASLLLYAGLRFTEARTIQWRGVGEGRLDVTGKGGRRAQVPMHPHLASTLDHWRGSGCPSPVWVIALTPRRAVSTSTIRRYWHAALDGTPLADVAPHQCRHRFGTDLLEATGDLAAVQEAMRHASPTTTRVYADVSESRITGTVARLDYIGTDTG